MGEKGGNYLWIALAIVLFLLLAIMLGPDSFLFTWNDGVHIIARDIHAGLIQLWPFK